MCVQKWRFPLGIRFAKIITCVSVYDNSVMSGWCALNQSLEKITKTILYHLQSKERVVSGENTKMNAVLSTVVALCNILCRFCVFTLMSESFSQKQDELNRKPRMFRIFVAASDLRWMHPQSGWPDEITVDSCVFLLISFLNNELFYIRVYKLLFFMLNYIN